MHEGAMAVPTRSMLMPILTRDADARGSIVSIVDEPVSNVSIITREPGSYGSNHYHYEDWHIMYVLEGRCDYFFKDRETGEIHYICVKPGENIFTPPMELHSTHFPVRTVMIVSSKNPRDQKTYEADTVREPFVDHTNYKEMLARFA
jgi:oxalate decarboxylase/phosphoglucose isomerase-like protein (cupin superfamily)